MTREDEDAIIRRLESMYGEAEDNETKEALFYAIEALKGKRPHGEWERTDNRWGVGAWRCTHCNSYYDIDTNYCPTCGASMFKKEGETNE